jgi:hypothetical protein
MVSLRVGEDQGDPFSIQIDTSTFKNSKEFLADLDARARRDPRRSSD